MTSIPADTPTFDVIATRLDGVEGWLTLDQARALHDAARPLVAGQQVVEIGSFRGRSTTVLGLTAGEGVQVVAIDPHAGNDRGPNELDGYAAEAATDHDVFLANLERAGITDRVRHLRSFSHDALADVDGDVDVLFIDGAHRYRPALDDMLQWGARVPIGGTLLIHDAFSSIGVTLAIGRALLLVAPVPLPGSGRLPGGVPGPAAGLHGRSPRQRRPPAGAAAVVRPQRRDQGPDRVAARAGDEAARPHGAHVALLAETRRHEAEAEAAAARAAPSLGHVPALDGLRGLAVLGVVAFHVGWIDGGYLGVDAFFVLSGFLITSLLLAEHDRRGRIALARFWGRRARRLLPAMLAMVAVVLVWTMAADRAQLDAVRGDAVATLLYVANWHEIATTSSYWAIFDAPSPLQHTWSLAIEEQFYLAWPLVVGGVALVAVRLRRRLAPVLGVVAVGAAAASYALMAALYDEGDASRAYFGTGSRLGAIVLGAALAALLGRRLLQPGPALGDRRLDVAAMVALAVLAWAWVSVEGTTPWLYRGGFALLGLAVVVVIAAACRPGIVATGLAWRPLRALGLISYGLYLWHWVVIAILTEARTGLHGLSLDLVQLVISLAAALASFWFLEQPIRTRRWLRTPKLATTAAIGAYGAVFALVGATLLVPGPDLDGLEQRLTAGSTVTPDSTWHDSQPGDHGDPGPRDDRSRTGDDGTPDDAGPPPATAHRRVR